MSISSSISTAVRAVESVSPSVARSATEETATAAGDGYTYSSSTIVRVALSASIIVVVVFAALMAMKVGIPWAIH